MVTTMILLPLAMRAGVASAAEIALSDEKLSATFGSAGADFARLMELKVPGGETVLDPEKLASGKLWSATFIGRGIGQVSLDSNDQAQACSSVEVLPGGSATSQSFKWVDCALKLPGPGPPAPPPPPPSPSPPGPKPFVTHLHSV
eukprot:SAG11_NODE_16185_length_555_cov_0.508772_1_plen_144_part_10